MAKTRSEIMEHIGEMLDHGLEHLVSVRPDHRAWPGKLARFAKDYVQNGTFGTQADRAEAILTLKRKVFKKITGLDPDTFSHYLNKHWLPDMEVDEE